MEPNNHQAAGIYRKIAIRIIPVLIVAYIIAFLDRANIGFAKLQFNADLGFNEAIYGLGGGLFYLGYSLFEVPSNFMLARIGARKTLLRIMVLWSIAATAMAFIQQPMHYYGLRFLLGAAEAGFFPGVLFYLTIWTPAHRRARFTMLFMSAIVISGVIGGPVSGLIMQYLDGFHGLHGWQWLFLIEGAPAAFMGVFVYFYLDNDPSSARWLSTEEKNFILNELKDDEVAKRAHSHSSFMAALKDVRFYALTGMSVALIADIGALFLWMPTIIRQLGVTNIWYVGLISCLPFSAALGTQFWVARRSDIKQERRWHTAIPALIAAAGWILLPAFSSSTLLSLMLLTIIAMGTFGATAPFWSLPSFYLSGTAAAGGIAVITTVGGIGGFVSPTIVGYITTLTGNLDFVQYYYGVLMLAGAILLIVGTARIPNLRRST